MTQQFTNTIYDILAQNEVAKEDRDHVTGLIDHVDTEKNTIVFKNNSKEFELKLIEEEFFK